MKFVLMLSVCSFLTGECKEPIKYEQTFDTWKDCAIVALNTSINFLEKFNDKELYVSYFCNKVEKKQDA